MRAVPAAPNVGILGIGLNVNQTPDEFPEELRGTAASLAMLTGEQVDRQTVAIALLRALAGSYGP
jgi:BirA family biotin operon repressor/biotin-[acetyl-CoA-carboxylase] ligase